MLRVPLIAVLALLMALPHGICFCDFLHAAPQHVGCWEQPGCCETQMPEVPAPPADDTDDHDRDCPCKLREVPAVSHAAANATELANATLTMLNDAAPPASFEVVVGDASHSLSFMPFDGTVPLTLRALRI